MAVAPLAVPADVTAALGRDLTSPEALRIDTVLAKLSELFRRRSGQQFTPGTSTVRLKVNGGRVFLPQHPLVSVTSVVDDAGEPVEYTLSGSWLTVDLPSSAFVTVDYAHGGTVPDLVRLAIADAARQVILIDPAAVAGVSQGSETTGPFTTSSTYAAWAVGGSTRLSPDDLALADSYRVRVPTVWVQQL